MSVDEPEIARLRKLARDRANILRSFACRAPATRTPVRTSVRGCEKGCDCSANGMRHELCARRREGVGTRYVGNAARCTSPNDHRRSGGVRMTRRSRGTDKTPDGSDSSMPIHAPQQISSQQPFVEEVRIRLDDRPLVLRVQGQPSRRQRSWARWSHS